MIPLAWSVGGIVWLALLPALVTRTLNRYKMVRPNFRGNAIPVGFGLLILLWSSPALAIAACAFPGRSLEHLTILLLSAAFGLLGFVDDRWGDRTVGGLRGHLRRSVLERRITTGFVKLAGGALTAFAVPYGLLHHGWAASLLDGALIALCANAFNLLDLRPGRCGALFLALGMPMALASWQPAVPPLLFILVPAFVVYVLDARGRVMLGDTGSNLLGAALGGSVVLLSPGTAVEGFIVALLALLHLIAERWSLSRIIEAAPLLRRLDRLTGVR